MENVNCIYCYQPINDIQEDPKHPKRTFTCRKCSLSFTKWDIERSQKRRDDLKHFRAQASPSEEECLSEAWQLMQQKEWDAALDRLFDHTRSLKHPLEFAFCRGVSQFGPVATCKDEQLGQRHSALNSLLNNLSVLDDYMPSDNKERFKTLTRISDALLLAAGLPIHCLSQQAASNTYTPPLDKTCQKRFQLLSGLADYIESITDEEFGAEYLQMVYTLWCTAWEQAKEPKNVVYLTRFDRAMRLSIKERHQIEDKIKELEIILSQRVPGFEPKQLSPWPPIIWEWQAAVILTGAICAFGLFLWYFRVPGNP